MHPASQHGLVLGHGSTAPLQPLATGAPALVLVFYWKISQLNRKELRSAQA